MAKPVPADGQTDQGEWHRSELPRLGGVPVQLTANALHLVAHADHPLSISSLSTPANQMAASMRCVWARQRDMVMEADSLRSHRVGREWPFVAA